MYPYQHHAERRMTELANRFAVPGRTSNVQGRLRDFGLETLDLGLEARILNQMARELLLAQSSDWAFQIYQGTTVEYSSRRFQSHIHRFNLLDEMLSGSPPYEGGVDAASAYGVVLSDHQLALLAEIESRDNIFPELAFCVYQS
jgi:1,4-alpha-glucan branching enzyme